METLPTERLTSQGQSLSITVLIPSYRRRADLERCLNSFSEQSLIPDAIHVIYRENDHLTGEFLVAYARHSVLPVVAIRVVEGGMVAALNAGLASITTDLVAMTDDDAIPEPTWLEKIEKTFAQNPDAAGVGGRDRVAIDKTRATAEHVGKITWYGRRIGNHHVGFGPARDVEILKGVNMAYRMRVVGNTRFDTRLRGMGAQVHNEIGFCMSIRNDGWRLIYDPQILVDHYPAERFDEDHRSQQSLIAQKNAAYNETLMLLAHLSPLRTFAFLLWSYVIGDKRSPGLLQYVRTYLKGQPVWYKAQAISGGRFEAIRDHFTHRLVERSPNTF